LNVAEGNITEFNLMSISDDCPPVARQLLLQAFRYGMMRGMNMAIEVALKSRGENGEIDPDVFGQKMLKMSQDALEALPT